MKVHSLPTNKAVGLNVLNPGACFQYDTDTFILLNEDSPHLKTDGAKIFVYAFNLTKSFITKFGRNTLVTPHKNACVVLDSTNIKDFLL